jgi:hypothetical protein
MHSLLITLALIGQTDVPLPPAPGVVSPPSSVAESAQDLKTWLLARLIIDLSFDTQKSADVERMLDRMNEQQLRALVAAYKERTSEQKQQQKMRTSKGQPETANDPALEQAKLDKQQAEAYRDHLKREYDRRVLQGHMTQNLVYQSIVNNQRMMYFNSSPFGYSPMGFGGLGYGAINYGGFGVGAPGFGGFYGGVW